MGTCMFTGIRPASIARHCVSCLLACLIAAAAGEAGGEQGEDAAGEAAVQVGGQYLH